MGWLGVEGWCWCVMRAPGADGASSARVTATGRSAASFPSFPEGGTLPARPGVAPPSCAVPPLTPAPLRTFSNVAFCLARAGSFLSRHRSSSHVCASLAIHCLQCHHPPPPDRSLPSSPAREKAQSMQPTYPHASAARPCSNAGIRRVRLMTYLYLVVPRLWVV